MTCIRSAHAVVSSPQLLRVPLYPRNPTPTEKTNRASWRVHAHGPPMKLNEDLMGLDWKSMACFGAERNVFKNFSQVNSQLTRFIHFLARLSFTYTIV